MVNFSVSPQETPERRTGSSHKAFPDRSSAIPSSVSFVSFRGSPWSLSGPSGRTEEAPQRLSKAELAGKYDTLRLSGIVFRQERIQQPAEIQCIGTVGQKPQQLDLEKFFASTGIS